MDLTNILEAISILDFKAMLAVAGLSMAITQYVKGWLPDKLIKPGNLLAGIFVAFLCFYKPNIPVDWVRVIANGVLGAIGADLGFNFLSVGKSPMFTLSSKPIPTPPAPKPKVEEPAVIIQPGLVEAVAAAIKASATLEVKK
jgi:hypothetical protein